MTTYLCGKTEIETCLNNKNPSTTPIVKDENSIKSHFRVVRAKRKRGRPKKKQTKKNQHHQRINRYDQKVKIKSHGPKAQ